MTYKEENIASALLEATSPAHRLKIWADLRAAREAAAVELDQIAETHRANGFINEYIACANQAKAMRGGLIAVRVK